MGDTTGNAALEALAAGLQAQALTAEQNKIIEGEICSLFQGFGLSRDDVLFLKKKVEANGGAAFDEVETPPEYIPRVRGPASYFEFKTKEGKELYVTLSSGCPYLHFYDKKK
ncbi:hypothetical protein QOT17_016637 [Balamuthia mandrillaris]